MKSVIKMLKKVLNIKNDITMSANKYNSVNTEQNMIGNGGTTDENDIIFDNFHNSILTSTFPLFDLFSEKTLHHNDNNINTKILRNIRKTVSGEKSNDKQEKEKSKLQHKTINGIQPGCRILDTIVPVTCEICNKLLKNRKCYKNHLKVHDPLKSIWKCHICGSVLSQEKHLITHIESHERILKCDICGKEMTYKTSLTLHMREHFDDKKFMCDFCGKRFVASSCLVRHRRTHTRVSPYECKECNKVFAQRVCYRLHQLNHHGGEPKYACEVCGKGFIIHCHLSKHMKTHEK